MDSTMKEKSIVPFQNADLGMYYCGQRIKTPNHSYGPEIRSHFLLVLVEKGTAFVYSPHKMTLGAHDLFVMFPGEKVHYAAQTDWSIRWIGIYGDSVEPLLKKCGITRKNPVCKISRFTETAELFSELLELADDPYEASMFKCHALLYHFFSLLLQNANPYSAADPVIAAKHIIQYNYNTDLTLTKLSQRLNLNISYFSRIFKEKTGFSPKQYIINIRMERAKDLLASTNFSVKEISYSVGFSDPLYFSRLFKQRESMSPLSYRNKQKL